MKPTILFPQVCSSIEVKRQLRVSLPRRGIRQRRWLWQNRPRINKASVAATQKHSFTGYCATARCRGDADVSVSQHVFCFPPSDGLQKGTNVTWINSHEPLWSNSGGLSAGQSALLAFSMLARWRIHVLGSGKEENRGCLICVTCRELSRPAFNKLASTFVPFCTHGEIII